VTNQVVTFAQLFVQESNAQSGGGTSTASTPGDKKKDKDAITITDNSCKP
jgi:hypothetical protein